MREMDAFEQAYKNGYAAGMKAAEEKIVHCKDCVFGGCFCHKLGVIVENDDFCSAGRRADNAAD